VVEDDDETLSPVRGLKRSNVVGDTAANVGRGGAPVDDKTWTLGVITSSKTLTREMFGSGPSVIGKKDASDLSFSDAGGLNENSNVGRDVSFSAASLC
jgi:hypothetical protein